ncbi:unnamed protein product [Fraxinus pennsylvanica]|uniref:Uncharacterized protein n=1 Tax=Fraxinus pennsylvanica TaxID=56036 RepID=A0AAD1YXI6_9LAMI|nr:unnamed protein product [Fraxinus pennsylvanica]
MGSFSFKSLSRKPLSLFINSSFLLLVSLYVISNSLNVNQSKNAISGFIHLQNLHQGTEISNCSDVHKFTDYGSKCRFVKSNSACWGKGILLSFCGELVYSTEIIPDNCWNHASSTWKWS